MDPLPTIILIGISTSVPLYLVSLPTKTPLYIPGLSGSSKARVYPVHSFSLYGWF